MTLQDVFKQAIKIVAIAKQFGFINVQIFKTDQDAYLHLLADLDEANPSADRQNNYILGAYLGQTTLGCNVVVHNASNTREECQQAVQNNLADITKWEAITSLFGDTSNSTTFQNVDTTQMDEFELAEYATYMGEVMNLAEEIIEESEKRNGSGESRSVPQPSFWKPRQTHTRSRSLDFAEATRKISPALRQSTSTPSPIVGD